jgi:type I restriction enzyme M protein
MLDSVTKKNIDDCRDVLVGKVPDPKSQIEQITIALIYKFMDDIDLDATNRPNGKAKFFTGDYAQYGWRELFRPELSGQEVLNLYSKALEQIPLNENIPLLFRNIFKNAYLPYRDPATLKLFLKHINYFTYSHSEKLGDAFEYLLSVMGSQGDAGQFRTPRNIIDFLVACVNPQKGETILDPACGTAGFLLSAYKHIIKQNTDKTPGDKLKTNERKNLTEHITGYDISPDMVRLSLANMYLHGFTSPLIHEYDTLSSEERWTENYDVILANPPFMTPKGGIRPHKRFGVQANKAEVLFTDYIAEHLSRNGRAGIIVPNGIVATTQTAYKALRRLLVADSLVAVISLPAGCFNPYSGVKTSILLLDKALAKKSKHILFLKIENDGFDLGAQRREIEKNDLPLALEAYQAYKESIREDSYFDEEKYCKIALLVEKETVLANKDVVLSGDRYVSNAFECIIYEMVKIGDRFKTTSGGTPSRSNLEYYQNGTIPWLKSGEVAQGYIYKSEEFITEEALKNSSAKLFPTNSVLVAMYGATAGQVGILKFEAASNQAVCAILPHESILPEYLYFILKQQTQKFVEMSTGGGQPNISQQIIRDFEIPLPPLDIQEQIVKEIEGYQKIIDGAKMVVDHYKPTIKINPDWEMVELGELATHVSSGATPKGGKEIYTEEGILFIRSQNVLWGTTDFSDAVFIPKEIHTEMKRSQVKLHDVFLNITGASIGRSAVMMESVEANVNQHVVTIRTKKGVLNPFYLSTLINSPYLQSIINNAQTGAARQAVNYEQIKEFPIPLPPIEEQVEIVARIEQEQQLVAATRQLIAIYEQKIKDKINEVWGVTEPVAEMV